jgi:hypothetical protein
MRLPGPMSNSPDGGVNSYQHAHLFSDTDRSKYSIHHTLGTQPDQAAPGNHTHASSGGSVTYGSPTTIAFSDVAADGVATTVARSDHKHGAPANPVVFGVAPTTIAYSDAAAQGASTSSARADHKHGMVANPFPGYGTAADNANVDATAEAAGASTTLSRADHKHTVNAGAPNTAAFSDTVSTGTATTLALSDHRHGMPANPFPGYGVAADNANTDHAAETAGVLTTVSRADHKHDVNVAAGSTQAFGDAAAAGSATTLALSDHKHGFPANPVPAFATPVALTGSTEGAGSATTIPRSDHTHRMPKKRIRCTTATANTTVTAASFTGSAAQALAAGKVYEFTAEIFYITAAATTGLQPQFTATGGLTATDIEIKGWNQTTATAIQAMRATALGTKLAFTDAIVAGSYMQITGTVKVNVAGSIEFQFASEVAASGVTIQAGSYWSIQEIAE